MEIKFGPAGLGPVKGAVKRLGEYSELGLRACEIAFTYGIYIKNEKDIKEIKESAEKNEIKLSIHAPYWINLNSKEEDKVRKSKDRILKCCEIGHKIGASVVVFHCGYYSGFSEEESYQNIKREILEMKKVIDKNKWDVELAPETMGKINVFGSVEQISLLAHECDCRFCLDFAHILARDKKVDYERIRKLFPQKKWHCHFSGIEYGEKGERRHIGTSVEGWSGLFEGLPKDKEIAIINESPFPVEDSVDGLRSYRELTRA